MRGRVSRLIGEVHLPSRGELQIVNTVEGPGGEHAGGGGGGEALARGEVRLVVVDDQTAHVITGWVGACVCVWGGQWRAVRLVSLVRSG